MTHVYVIQAEGGPVKVGIAADPTRRLHALRTGTPYKLSLAHVEPVADVRDAAAIERAAHRLLAGDRVHGEWFAVSADQAKEAVLTSRVEALGPSKEAASSLTQDLPQFHNAHGRLSRFAVMALAVLPSMQKEGRARMRRGRASSDTFYGEAYDEIGRIFGISGRQLRKIVAVWSAANADGEQFGHLRDEMDDTGKVDRAYKQLTLHKGAKFSQA